MLAQKLKQRSAHKRRRNNCKCRAIRKQRPRRFAKRGEDALRQRRVERIGPGQIGADRGDQQLLKLAVEGDDLQLFLQRSEEHTSELQSLMRISYAVFCLKKKHKPTTTQHQTHSKLIQP